MPAEPLPREMHCPKRHDCIFHERRSTVILFRLYLQNEYAPDQTGNVLGKNSRISTAHATVAPLRSINTAIKASTLTL
ncbi:hypothetical protein Y032_0065g3611 [Ancylostoma ceylanicum]|uniref:Uncharacterized protein n=1 Tax=Ancylostoma ceylanicum TaxID=53326 RepID=A0A016U0T1_9BILA|nr:hypothetical protein Y032_0065g3611 [Ancylostoma ceylanicum]